MRILLVTDVYNWGGHVRALYIKKFLSDEFDFDIMDGKEFGDYLKSEEEKTKYDLIYLLFHTMLMRRDVTNLLKFYNEKVLTIVTSYPTLRAPCFQNSIDRFEKRANKCVGIAANNQMSLDDLRSIYKGETWYASRGVDETVFYQKNGFREKREADFTVAYVGKPVKEKGLDMIKSACQMAGVKFIFNDRNFTNALTPQQMNEFYNRADAYVVASTIDGTPNPALEAAACGLTLVANKIGNMPELIVNGVNGFLIERDVYKYAHRLRWLKRNQRKSWEIGQKGKETILKDWTWKSVLNKNEREIFRCIRNL